jgi:uncharacterized protein (TIGR03066 family)
MSSPESTSPVLPEQFGKYQIIRPLGRGGMGAVYLARDTRLDRDVAIKVCHLADNAQAMERFRREAKAAASLSHTNLCPIYEFDERDGIAYLTMAFVEGPTLNAWAAKRGLSQRDAALLVAKLALAMQVAHEAGVVHRDLKPGNIVINKKGEPIILDFGLARQLDDPSTRLTQQGAIYGTPSYMAPEQAGGDPRAIGPACDIYALGVILYELLTGNVPFQGSLMAVLSQLLHAAPEPVRARNPAVNPALETICLKALAKKPEDRPRSMKELARDLARIARSSSTTARSAAPPPLPVPLPTGPTIPEPQRQAPIDLAHYSNPAAPYDTYPEVRRRGTLAPRPPYRAARHPTWIAWVIAGVLMLLLGGVAGVYYVLRHAPTDAESEPTARTNRDRLIGTWDKVRTKPIDLEASYEFTHDGRLIVTKSEKGTWTEQGNYTLNGDTLQVNLLGESRARILTIRTLTDRNLVVEESFVNGTERVEFRKVSAKTTVESKDKTPGKGDVKTDYTEKKDSPYKDESRKDNPKEEPSKDKTDFKKDSDFKDKSGKDIAPKSQDDFKDKK